MELVFGVLSQKFSILRGTLLIEFVSKNPDQDSLHIDKKPDQDSPHNDKKFRMCCCLCNVCDSVVLFNNFCIVIIMVIANNVKINPSISK